MTAIQAAAGAVVAAQAAAPDKLPTCTQTMTVTASREPMLTKK